MKFTAFLFFLLPIALWSQNKVGINIDTPQFELDIRSLNDSTDFSDLQLANPAGNHFIRLSGGRGFDPKPGLIFNRTDTFRISSANPDFSLFKQRFTLFPDGKVGLDILYPVRRLHARGDGIFTEGTSLGMASDTGTLTLIDEEFRQLSMDGDKVQTYNIEDQSPSFMYLQPYGGNIDFGNGDIILNNNTSLVELAGTLKISPLSGVGERNLVVDPAGNVKTGPGGADTDWEKGPSSVFNLSDNVGIGFSDLSARLQVFGPENDLEVATVKFVNATPPLGADTMYFDGDEIDVVSSGLGTSRLKLQGNSTGSIEMVVGGGNVGVGTNAPSQRRMIVAGPEIPVEGPLAQLPATFSVINLNEQFDEMVMDGNEIHTVDNDLFINSKSENNVYLASGGGNVGIGTDVLANGFRLSVDGGIIGEEVRVQFKALWPDYVFDDNYNLQHLADLERDINELGHLPGIPSAEEVNDKGIDLGTMDARLLEKIEELTLHVIELNKRITKLEEENASLKSK